MDFFPFVFHVGFEPHRKRFYARFFGSKIRCCGHRCSSLFKVKRRVFRCVVAGVCYRCVCVLQVCCCRCVFQVCVCVCVSRVCVSRVCVSGVCFRCVFQVCVSFWLKRRRRSRCRSKQGCMRAVGERLDLCLQYVVRVKKQVARVEDQV